MPGMKRKRLGRLRVIDNAMSRLSVTDRLRRMPRTLAVVELAYQTVKDRYMAILSRHKQLAAELEDTRDAARIEELRELLTKSNGDVQWVRRMAQQTGKMAYGQAFVEAAWAMLPREVFHQIRIEAEEMMGRSNNDIADKGPDFGLPFDTPQELTVKFERLLRLSGLLDDERDVA